MTFLHASTSVERYVDARELAELMGVSISTIKRMRAAGMPSETWGLSRTRRYLPSQAIAWAHQRTKMSHRWDRADNAPSQRQPKE